MLGHALGIQVRCSRNCIGARTAVVKGEIRVIISNNNNQNNKEARLCRALQTIVGTLAFALHEMGTQRRVWSRYDI